MSRPRNYDHTKGQRNGRAKLTPEQVLAIRADNRPLKIIGREYGLRFSHIGDIRKGRYWANVQPQPQEAGGANNSSRVG